MVGDVRTCGYYVFPCRVKSDCLRFQVFTEISSYLISTNPHSYDRVPKGFHSPHVTDGYWALPEGAPNAALVIVREVRSDGLSENTLHEVTQFLAIQRLGCRGYP